MTVDEVMAELEKLGTTQTAKTFRNHGATGDLFGVKIGDLKKVLKKIRHEQELAIELWDTGNSDAMYLAAMVADGSRMTRKQLDHWAKSAWWHMLGEFAVPSVAAQHPDAASIAMRWIGSRQSNVAASGWCTYSLLVAVRPDDQLDLDEIRGLLRKVESEIHTASNRVRLCMNGWIIAVGGYVKPLLREAKALAKKVGTIEADMGNTCCKIPNATEYLAKIESMGRVGQKRKSTKC